jgi:transcriptional regulator with XRE-family HTH domain
MKDHEEPDTHSEPTLGGTVRQYREAAGLSIRQLAPLVGAHHSMLARIEANQTTPSADLVQRIADVLEADASELLAYIGVKPNTPEPRVYFRKAYGLSDAEALEIVRELDERYGKNAQQEDK